MIARRRAHSGLFVREAGIYWQRHPGDVSGFVRREETYRVTDVVDFDPRNGDRVHLASGDGEFLE